ncbi:hypothetical protein BFW01_g7073 [Lasiodiplodia theobromae]|nr:hypothetical protein BFW01_g7073 [Lasiodiplodia theobromae]
MRPSEPTRAEHQTSNSTANAFLGGRRMPTWLTTGQPQVNASPLLPSRKRPAPRDFDPPKRPSKPTQNPPSSSASPNLPCVTAAPAAQPPLSVAVQNASNPASPALPNVVASQISRASSTTENNILPSPAPSEDPAMHPSASSKEPAGHRVRATSIAEHVTSVGREQYEDVSPGRHAGLAGAGKYASG